MLTLLNIAQLILYIALLGLVGQGLLYVLAGEKRQGNVFYKVLQTISSPFTALVRKVTPAKVADAHVPLVTFFWLLLIYVVVTFEKIDWCMRHGMEGCR